MGTTPGQYGNNMGSGWEELSRSKLVVSFWLVLFVIHFADFWFGVST